MTEISSPITSITGIGDRLGAIILAEIRDIHNSKTLDQLQAFARFEPSVWPDGCYWSYGQAWFVLFVPCTYPNS